MRALRLAVVLLPTMVTAFACGGGEDETTTPNPVGGAGAAGTAGASGASGASGTSGASGMPAEVKLDPWESCEVPSSIHLRASPSKVFIAPGKTRDVEVVVEPDICQRSNIEFTVEGAAATIVSAVGADTVSKGGATISVPIDIRHPKVKLVLSGVSAGKATLKASLKTKDGDGASSTEIEVLEAKVPTCSGSASGKVMAGGTIGGTADLMGASLGLQAGADTPARATEEGFQYETPVIWSQAAFDGTVGCASADILPAGMLAVGPAVTFGPETKVFPREIPMAIPINPAMFPDKARLRHLKVSYSGPAFKAPRTIPVADPWIDKQGDAWVLRFMAPRLGTYQAVISPDAGTKTAKRRITHRAIMGVSMGGGGTASLGFRNHDKFDVLAPLGGPVDWTWLMDHIEHNHTGGFPTNDGDNVPTTGLVMPTPKDPYEHPSTFNSWWYEYPRSGNGGSFSRYDYVQIFRDLALMFGNPNGENTAPGGENLPAGVDPNGKSVLGDHTGKECAVWLDPIDKDPEKPKQEQIVKTCQVERCKNPQTLTKYYDREFNPKGKWPVITVCDGGQQDKKKSPYANQWQEQGREMPLEVALAVDYNGNGLRDPDEPIIRQGHEPWKDVGIDGKASVDEPGYVKGVNEDPAGDDYNAQYNPGGTEGNARWEEGEPFDDVGLDGVPNTKSSPYDLGEGDGKFTVAKGLERFWDRDSRSIIHQSATPPGGKFDDAAMARIDVWTDGGVRDLFNFGVDAQHLMGSYASRGRDVHYYTDFSNLPGQVRGKVDGFLPQALDWQDLPGSVLMRYGKIDPSVQDLDDGSGQHVGTVPELAGRLRSALYFASQRWPDAPRTLVDEAQSNPAPGIPQCQIIGNCGFTFTDSRGRVGPVTVTLPPGYGHALQQGIRYPVIYLLHGYGQTPEDLGAAIVFLRNWMNSSLDSSATRLSKAIVVYADGRCRKGPSGDAECIRGTFYADSPKANGGKLESWFLELMQKVDTDYRTLPETTIDWEQ